MNGLDTKTTQDAHKVAYLIQQFPKHTMAEIIALLVMPAIDINTAIWAAQDMNLIGEPDEKTGKAELLEPPKSWDFGTDEKHLENVLLYCFGQLAKKETDLEETYLSNWTNGYTAHDVLIALRRLLESRQLAEYQIDDTDKQGVVNAYTFFTLYDNREQLWGTKQFKEPPVSEAQAETEDK